MESAYVPIGLAFLGGFLTCLTLIFVWALCAAAGRADKFAEKSMAGSER